MKTTLYVDVSGTLINAHTKQPNPRVVDFVENYDGDVVVWSGYGMAEAERVGVKTLTRAFAPGTKSLTAFAPKPGDTIIDDDYGVLASMRALGGEIGFKVFHPDELPS